MRLSSWLKVSVLAGLASIGLGAAASPASAAWTSNGPLFINGSTPTVKISTNIPLKYNPGQTAFVTCSGGAPYGNRLTGMFGGPTGPASGAWNLSAITYGGGPVSLTTAGCRYMGNGMPVDVDCAPGATQFWATSYAPPIVSGELRVLVCSMVLRQQTTSFPECVISFNPNVSTYRSLYATYNNTTGVMTLDSAGQTMGASFNSACTSLDSPATPATATITNASGGSLAYTFTGVQPSITG